MASTAPRIASLDRARFDRLMAVEADALARLSAARENLSTFCRAYSAAHGCRVHLTSEQVERDMTFRDTTMGAEG